MGTIVRSLLELGLIEELAMARRRGPGAPATGIQLRPDGAFSLGFGLERDSLSGVLVDLAGNRHWQYKRAVEPGEPATTTLESVAAAVHSVTEGPSVPCPRERICGLGIAVPGPISLAGGIVVGPPDFPGWENVPIASLLEEEVGLPVLVDNAATAAALGVEWQMPPAHGSFLYCYWGLGIGGGLVLGREAYRGNTGNAAEIGHIVVNIDGHRCGCGGRGCLEAEASAGALLRDARRYGAFVTIEEVAAAATNIPELRAMLERAAQLVAAGLVSALNMTDVLEVVIGGAHFAAVEEIFLPVIQGVLAERLFRRQVAPVTVRTAPAGEEVNAIGAAAMVLHERLPYEGERGKLGR